MQETKVSQRDIMSVASLASGAGDIQIQPPKKDSPLPDVESYVSFAVKANNKELDLQVVSINVYREFNRISTAEIVLLDGDAASGDFELSNAETLITGKPVEILAGYDGHNETVFKGIIVKHAVRTEEGKSNLIITAKHKACKMTFTRRNNLYTDKSDSDIISEIINQSDLTPDVESTSIVHESLTQYNCSDWDFINMRAEVNSMLVYTTEDKIIIKKPNLSGKAKLVINYGSDIFDFEAEMDGSNAFPDYAATSWSYINQEAENVSQNSAVCEIPQGNLSSSDLAGAMDNKTCEIPVQMIFNDNSELTELLKSVVQRDNLSRITGKVRTYGYANIHPGDLIDLQRVGKRFNGINIVSGVEHEIKEGGWYTTIRFGIDKLEYAGRYHDINGVRASGILPAINGLQTGKVVKISEDPLGESRVLVLLSNFVSSSGEEGIWARMATFYAGNERGFFFLPEVDDEVIVGFIDDHPDNAVILGSLNSSTLPPAQEADENNNIKGIYTRSKIKLEFDDDKTAFSIETPAGNMFSISDDDESISLKDQNGNEIVMDSNGIAFKSDKKIVFEASGDVSLTGNNVEITAKGSFKAEGTSGAELSTSANAVIKGSMVQIN